MHSLLPALLVTTILAWAPAALAAGDKSLSQADQDAIKACDEGASVPLDPQAKARPVWDTELLLLDAATLRNYERPKLTALAKACTAAAQALPGDKRLQLEALRTQFLLGGDVMQMTRWAADLRPLAEAGSAEARFLTYSLFDQASTSRASSIGIAKTQALAALESAAAAGHVEALETLFSQYRSGPLYRRDPAKALEILRKVLAQPTGAIAAGEQEAKIRDFLQGSADEIVLESPTATPAEKSAAFADVEAKRGGSLSDMSLIYARALRRGEGTAKDAVRARKLLQEMVDQHKYGQGLVDLAEMMANGEGGPADGKAAIALLRRDDARYAEHTGQVLATLLLDGRFVGRQPLAAIDALASNARDIDASIRLVDLILDYHPHLANAEGLIKTLTAAAEVEEPGAVLALARLKLSGDAPFTDVDGARGLLKGLATKGERAALYLLAGAQYQNLDSTSFKPSRRADDLSDEQLKALLAEGAGRKEAAALLLKAKFERAGIVYAQDDEAASEDLARASDLGSAEALVLLGDAYDKGLGVAKNPDHRVVVWRKAARLGSLEARRKLAEAFPFDFFDKLITLREGVTERIALVNDGIDRPIGGFGMDWAGLALEPVFSSVQAREAGANAVAQAVLDSYRVAPAGLADDTLVAMAKAYPDDVRAAMETILKRDGFYAGEPRGYFGPEVRKALAAWVDAKGPLPDEAPAGAAAGTGAAAPADDGLPQAVYERVRDMAYQKAKAVKSKAERHASIVLLDALAGYGDTASRWALFDHYDNADFIRNVVTPEEAVRYGVDLMVRRPEGTEKASIDFSFVATTLLRSGKKSVLGESLLSAMRDTPALQDPLTLGSFLQELVTAPGACDELLAAAGKAGAVGLGSDGCDDASKDALLAFIKAKGPAGVETAARKKAAAEILALDKAK